MTQQEIVNAVNHLTVGYNLSWQDIKYDADKAIMKINSYVGSMFPKMSEVLTGPNTTYSFEYKGKSIPFFPEQYIHSVVIPFIASEVLARDEEFTTIYNKYLLEVEDGLFLMVSNEYNKIHPMFLQHDTTGVFFSEDTMNKEDTLAYSTSKGFYPEHMHHHHTKEPEHPEYTFSVNYLVNNPNIMCDDSFVIDSTKYKYGDEYNILAVPDKHYYNVDHTKRYTLEGWYSDTMCLTKASKGVIRHDEYIYAKWQEEDTLYFNSGTLTLKYNDFTYLALPRFVQGHMVTEVTNAAIHDKLKTLIIPDTVQNVNIDFKGEELLFPKNGNITITHLGLANSKLDSDFNINKPLILPRSVKYMIPSAFGTVISLGSHEIYKHIDVICLRATPDEDFTLPEGMLYVEVALDTILAINVHYVGDR